MKLFPPTGLEYVATSAKGLTEKITLLDLRYEEHLSKPDALLDFIRSSIDIICVSIGWDRQYKEICDLLDRMPDDIPLIVGGYKATEKAEELLREHPTIDIVVRGEGEETIREILEGRPLERITGISYRRNGTVIHNANRPFSPVESIAAPDRSLRHNQYFLAINGVSVSGLTFDSVLSARGCPFNCKFCTFNINPLGQKRGYAARSARSVIEEIEGISAKVILMSDDNFAANPKRAEEICDALIERKIKKRFIAQARLELARSPRLLEKMVRAGFKVLLIGIESPHDWILKQLNKGFDAQTIRASFAVLKKYPILYNGYFIYGNIGETEEEMLSIASFAKEIGVDIIAFHKLRIEQFSPLRELAERTPGYHVTDTGALYSDTYSHAALKKIARKIKFSFYTPARYLAILRRCFFEVKFFTFGETIRFFAVIPLVLKGVIARERQKGRLSDSLRRTFISNK